jgi:hypothetical protein
VNTDKNTHQKSGFSANTRAQPSESAPRDAGGGKVPMRQVARSEGTGDFELDVTTRRRGYRATEPTQVLNSSELRQISRSGELVREDRAFPDGTILRRHQFGSGPSYFEPRRNFGADDKQNWASRPGYAYGREYSNSFWPFEWTFR